MPHVVVKLVPGRSEELKKRLAMEICETVVSVLECREKLISVAIEEVAAEDWTERVYKPEIEGKWNTLYKEPGYKPSEEGKG